jgi:hypothetical protein
MCVAPQETFLGRGPAAAITLWKFTLNNNVTLYFLSKYAQEWGLIQSNGLQASLSQCLAAQQQTILAVDQ